MADVEDNQSPQQKNLSELLHVYNFVQMTSMGAAIVLAYTPTEGSALIISYPLCIVLIFSLQEGTVPWVYIAQSIFIVFLEVAYYCSSKHDLGYAMLYVGSMLIVVSVIGCCVAGVFYVLTKQLPGNADLGHLSTRLQMMVLHFLVLLFGNGCTMFSLWCLEKRDQRWRTISLVIISVVGFGSFCCCIQKLVRRWQEHRRNAVQVSAAISPG